MATLESPAGYRIQDVDRQFIVGPIAPGTGMTPVAEQSVESAVNSAQGLIRRAANLARRSSKATVNSAPHEDPPPFAWPAFRIYYPAGASAGAPPLSGPFPLVIFAHGQRDPDKTGLYPDPRDPDPNQDYKRWGGVLHLLARTGIVVASIQMTGALGSDTVEEAARRIETVERWLYQNWEHRDMLVSWVTDGRRRDHRHRPLSLIGHSWGIEGCARVARERDFVEAVAGIAPTWRGRDPRRDIAEARVPTLLIAGAEDDLAGPNSQRQVYDSVDPSKHVATVEGTDHWDWFDDDGLTPPPPPDGEIRCQVGYRIARELLAVFLHRYLNRRSNLPPSLLTMSREWRWFPPRKTWVSDTAGRPSLDLSSPCAIEVDWTVNESKSWEEPVEATGSETLEP